MICANCKEEHDTLAEVRACHGAPDRSRNRTSGRPWSPNMEKIRTVTCLNPTCHESTTGPVKDLLGWKCSAHGGSPTLSVPAIEVGQKVAWNSKRFEVLSITTDGVMLKTGAKNGKFVSFDNLAI